VQFLPADNYFEFGLIAFPEITLSGLSGSSCAVFGVVCGSGEEYIWV